MLARDMPALEAEFSGRAGARASHHETVYHVSLALVGGDRLTDAAWRSLIERFVWLLGFQDAAYVVVRQETPTGLRVHLIAARFDAWGHRIVAPNGVHAEQFLAAARWDCERRVRRCRNEMQQLPAVSGALLRKQTAVELLAD